MPDKDKVMKITTIDPNNTASIKYVAEGKTIATSLTKLEQDNTATVDPLDTENSGPLTILDALNRNIKVSNGYISSKRLTLLEDEQISLEYNLSVLVEQSLCIDSELDCDYRLEVSIRDLQNGALIAKSSSIALSEFEAVNDFKTIYFSPPSPIIPNVTMELIHQASGGSTSFTLNKGSYIIEKRIIIISR